MRQEAEGEGRLSLVLRCGLLRLLVSTSLFVSLLIATNKTVCALVVLDGTHPGVCLDQCHPGHPLLPYSLPGPWWTGQ